MRIIFQDIDGPLIPLRMYYRGRRPFNTATGSFVYDPVAVDMINCLCEKFEAKVVFNTAHNENPEEIMRHQGNVNGLKYLHEEYCKTNFEDLVSKGRHAAIQEWLTKYSPGSEWIVIDDILVYEPNQVIIDYSMGMTINSFYKACELFGEKLSPIIGQTNPINYKV